MTNLDQIGLVYPAWSGLDWERAAERSLTHDATPARTHGVVSGNGWEYRI